MSADDRTGRQAGRDSVNSREDWLRREISFYRRCGDEIGGQRRRRPACRSISRPAPSRRRRIMLPALADIKSAARAGMVAENGSSPTIIRRCLYRR